MPFTAPNPVIDWIYEGTTVADFDDATGIRTNLAPKMIHKNQEDLITYINDELPVIGRNTNLNLATVGPGGNFPTITEVLKRMSRVYPSYDKTPVRGLIQLLPGYVFNEEIHIDGIDLSYITIESTQGVTPYTVNSASLVTDFDGAGKSCVIGVKNGGCSPVLNFIARFDTAGSGLNKHGLYVIKGSKAIGAGFLGFQNTGADGISCHVGSSVSVQGDIDCSDAGQHGISASHNSSVHCHGTMTVNNSVAGGVLASMGGSITSTFILSANDCGGIAVDSQLGSLISSWTGIHANRSADVGVSAAAGSLVSSKSIIQCTASGVYSVIAGQGSTVSCYGSIDARNSYNGCIAINGGVVASMTDMDNTGYTNAGVIAESGGLVTARGSMNNRKTSGTNRTTDCSVFYGGMVTRVKGFGGTNIAAGRMTSSGYINQ